MHKAPVPALQACMHGAALPALPTHPACGHDARGYSQYKQLGKCLSVTATRPAQSAAPHPAGRPAARPRPRSRTLLQTRAPAPPLRASAAPARRPAPATAHGTPRSRRPRALRRATWLHTCAPRSRAAARLPRLHSVTTRSAAFGLPLPCSTTSTLLMSNTCVTKSLLACQSVPLQCRLRAYSMERPVRLCHHRLTHLAGYQNQCSAHAASHACRFMGALGARVSCSSAAKAGGGGGRPRVWESHSVKQ